MPEVAWTSFAGTGASRPEAERNAFERFIRGPFHTLLTGFGGHHCAQDQTEWFDWRGGAGAWRICSSPLLLHGEGAASPGYAEFVEVLRDLFVQEVASGSTHWCEVFFASLDGQRSAAEVRLDNALWPRAIEALERWHVPPPQGYQSGRHFFIALPAVPV